jgi:hypothetical protein
VDRQEGREVTVEDVKCDFDWDNASTDDERFEASVENVARSKMWQIQPHGMGPNGYIVYSFWDDNKICIYVGITNDPWHRMGEHISTSQFAWEIFDWRIEAAELDKNTALRLETILIRRWNPRCNDRKSIYKDIKHPAIFSVDAAQVHFQRLLRGTLMSDLITEESFPEYGYESFPKIVQDHKIRFEKWLADFPEVNIREWPTATGLPWSTLLGMKRDRYLQDTEVCAK